TQRSRSHHRSSDGSEPHWVCKTAAILQMLDRAARVQQGNPGPGGAVGELLRQSWSWPVADLTWWSVGIGYYPVTTGITPYDQSYFDRFARQAETPIGCALMDARANFVARHYRGLLCDVGIGSGAFITRRGSQTFGWDVNPAGLRWLRRCRRAV